MAVLHTENTILFFHQELIQLVHEGVDILELAVDGRKAYIRDLVHVLELIHGQLADGHRGDLSVEGALELGFDRVYHLLDLFNGDRALLTCTQDTGSQLGAVKDLARFVALDDHDRDGLDHLMGGKTLAAFQTFTTAADTLTLVGGTGIDNLAFFKSTVGTLHIYTPIS